MSAHYLSRLFCPKSIAVAGATEREQSLGRIVFENLRRLPFSGALYPVNPKYDNVLGTRCFHSLAELPAPPDLLVVTSPATSVAGLIEDAGKCGIHHALVLSAGFAEAGEAGQELLKELRKSLQQSGVRMLGPNCIGLFRPSLGMNASFADIPPRAGSIALISQSGAVCSALLDWAATTYIGFSSVISLGGAIDIDFGEALDFLVDDHATTSILLYVEGIRDARNFLSALRRAARVKPVIVFKAGRNATGTQAVTSHTGALAGSDAVFDAALARSGTVRVKTSLQLFAAARMLASRKLPPGDRLAIVTNGGGPGVIAADCAADDGIPLAVLSAETVEKLDRMLPTCWSHGNPVDVIGDATPERYRNALQAVLEDPQVDAVHALFCPQAVMDAKSAANAVIEAAQGRSKPVFTTWLGGASIEGVQQQFEKAGIPSFLTPENAVDAYSFMVRFRQHQEMLLQSAAAHGFPDRSAANVAIALAVSIRDKARHEGRKILNEVESKSMLAAFGIATNAGELATDARQAVALAEKIGFPVVLKVQSDQVTHKSDAGGVRTNLQNARQVHSAFEDILERVASAVPEAVIDGVLVQPMLRYAHQREVLIGIKKDPVFGPVVAFGAGGIAVEAVADIALSLPPLNVTLAQDLIAQTRMARILNNYRTVPAVDMGALSDALVRVSTMAALLPWIEEMDLNPALAHPEGLAVVDARIVLNEFDPDTDPRFKHMAIFPYPVALERSIHLKDGARLIVRPIRPDDVERELNFVAGLDETTRYLRFQHPVRQLSQDMLMRFTQLDYATEMALVGVDPRSDAFVGIARYFPNPDRRGAEFAVTVADAWQHHGLGEVLMRALIDCAKEAGFAYLESSVLPVNTGMLHLASTLGFKRVASPEYDSTVHVRLELAAG